MSSAAAEAEEEAATVAKSDAVDASRLTVADSAPVPKSETDPVPDRVVKPRCANETMPAGAPGAGVVNDATPDSPATSKEFVPTTFA